MGAAKANDMLRLIRLVSDSVYTVTGYRMETEVVYISPMGIKSPADCLSDHDPQFNNETSWTES